MTYGYLEVFKMNKGYDFKKTLSKAGWVIAEVIVAGVIAYLSDNQMALGLIPLMEMAKNYLKHRND